MPQRQMQSSDKFCFSDLPPKQYVCKLLYKLKKQTTIIKLSFVARLLLFVYPLVACFVPQLECKVLNFELCTALFREERLQRVVCLLHFVTRFRYCFFNKKVRCNFWLGICILQLSEIALPLFRRFFCQQRFYQTAIISRAQICSANNYIKGI